MTDPTVREFEFLNAKVRITERETALHAKFSASIDGEPTGVAFHLQSSAEADARREILRRVAERRRLSGQPVFALPPSDSAYASADEEDGEKFDLCS